MIFKIELQEKLFLKKEQKNYLLINISKIFIINYYFYKMKHFLIIILYLFCFCSTQQLLGPVVSLFNGFFFGDFIETSSYVTGRLAVEGNIKLYGQFSVGESLSEISKCGSEVTIADSNNSFFQFNFLIFSFYCCWR